MTLDGALHVLNGTLAPLVTAFFVARASSQPIRRHNASKTNGDLAPAIFTMVLRHACAPVTMSTFAREDLRLCEAAMTLDDALHVLDGSLL